MLNRIGPCWTLYVFISPTTTRVIWFCTPPFSSGIRSTRVTYVSHSGPLCRGNCSRLIARTGLYPPPGISDGAFQLRMNNIWFCKLLLLFKIHTKTDTGMQYHKCAYVSVLEEYKGPRKQGHILHILYILICLSFSAWLDQCQSAFLYERHEQAQVLYVIPVSSILGRLPLVPVGATGTIPFTMHREAADFPGAFCDKSANSGDGCRW